MTILRQNADFLAGHIQPIHSLILTDLMMMCWVLPSASENHNVLVYLPWLTLRVPALN